MVCEDRIRDLPVVELCHRCHDEIAHYRRREPYDDRYCFAMIRLAIIERDDICWQAMHTIYGQQLQSWCRQAGAGSEADLDELASVAWQKLWQSYTVEKLAGATSSGAVLQYLKMCAHSAVIDALRRSAMYVPLDASLMEPTDRALAPDEVQAKEDARARFWEIVHAALRDERERNLVYLMYELGLRSAEIQARRPDLFPEIGDVYRLTRNIQMRLARNAALRAWREENER